MREMKTKGIKWRNIFETVRSEVLLGKFDVRERFPSEVQLCRRFGVSRPTIRLALDELKRTGILEARPGSGTYLSAMARNATGYLGMIVPGIASSEIFSPICAEIARHARDAGYTLIFGDASSKDPETRARQARDLARQYAAEHVAGVFLEPIELVPGAAETTEEILSILSDHNTPVVLLDRDIVPPPGRSRYDLVGIDNVQAGYRLTRHLVECGARRICFFLRVGSAPTVSLRIQGAREAVLDAGLSWTSANVCVAELGNPAPIAKLAGGRHPPDAFICGNDATAAALLQTLTALGKRVPRDFLLAGFDDVRIATLTSPPLTTIRQPCDLIARTAVDTLLTRLRDPSLPPREVHLDVSLIVRHSTAVASVASSTSPAQPAIAANRTAAQAAPRAETIPQGAPRAFPAEIVLLSDISTGAERIVRLRAGDDRVFKVLSVALRGIDGQAEAHPGGHQDWIIRLRGLSFHPRTGPGFVDVTTDHPARRHFSIPIRLIETQTIQTVVQRGA